VILQANQRVLQESRRVIATHNGISWDFWAARLGLEMAWRGFWARPVISQEINKFLQIRWDPDVRFQCAELHETQSTRRATWTWFGTNMNLSPLKNTWCDAVFLHGTHEHTVPEVYSPIWLIVSWLTPTQRELRGCTEQASLQNWRVSHLLIQMGQSWGAFSSNHSCGSQKTQMAYSFPNTFTCARH